MGYFRNFFGKGYAPLNDDEESDEKISKRSRGVSGLFKCFVLVLAISVVGSLGFLVGRRSINEQTNLQYNNATVSSFLKVFAYNSSFAEDSKETSKAWKELFPSYGGFFSHPTLAPQRSAFSVFHQLHCLNGIREGYYALYVAMNEHRVLSDDDMPKMSSPRHIRHCIELLRQVLMCQPDLTVEVKNLSVGGVAGFGTEHQCRDWNQLMSFTKEWETWGLDEVPKAGGGMHNKSYHP